MLSLLIFLTLFAARSAATFNRIVGGHEVNIRERPFQAAVLLDGSGWCSGVIISRDWILTAAHCVDRVPANSFSVRVGSGSWSEGGQISQVDWIQKHPLFNKRIADYDIAVIHVSTPLKLDLHVQPVTLPMAEEVWGVGRMGTVSGWGFLGNHTYPKNLQAVRVPIIDKDHCKRVYKPAGMIVTERMLCAGLPQGGKDACLGDSGGPLTVYNPPVLAGLVSWGAGCAATNRPGVYVDVAVVRSFIERFTQI